MRISDLKLKGDFDKQWKAANLRPENQAGTVWVIGLNRCKFKWNK